MRYIKILFTILWRLWFYIIMTLSLITISPLLLIYTSNEKYYNNFYLLAHYWSRFILLSMGFKVKILEQHKITPNQSYMFTPNHTALIDPMLTLALFPNNSMVFVGKKELGNIPIFGFFYKKTCIIVDRSSRKSRANVYTETNKKLSKGYSICIFPEGGVPDESITLDQFKNGAFSLAITHNVPIVPISFLNCKQHFSWTFLSGGPGTLLVKIHNPITTEHFTLKDVDSLKQQTRQIILNDLTKYNKTS